MGEKSWVTKYFCCPLSVMFTFLIWQRIKLTFQLFYEPEHVSSYYVASWLLLFLLDDRFIGKVTSISDYYSWGPGFGCRNVHLEVLAWLSEIAFWTFFIAETCSWANIFLHFEVVSITPNPKLEDHSWSAVHDCIHCTVYHIRSQGD